MTTGVLSQSTANKALMMSRKLTRPELSGLTLVIFVGAGIWQSSPVRAAADPLLNAFEACTEIDADSDQLACFRETLARLKAEESARALPAPDEASGPADRDGSRRLDEEREALLLEARQAAKQEFGLGQNTRQEQKAEAPAERSDEPAATVVRELKDASREPPNLQATIAASSRTAYGKIIVTLDNGQVWQETDGSYYRRSVRVGREVIISKRRLGGYQMKIGDQPGVVLVRRIR
jgi:hypothetical protein